MKILLLLYIKIIIFHSQDRTHDVNVSLKFLQQIISDGILTEIF
jgi:hypothetical protein